MPALGYQGGLEENFLLPTAVGAAKPSAVVPETMAAATCAPAAASSSSACGLKDFYPAYLADNLALLGPAAAVSARAIELAAASRARPTWGALGFARRFEQPAFRDWIVARARPGESSRTSASAFPRCSGSANAGDGLARARGAAGAAGLRGRDPAAVACSGIRLFDAMTAALRQAGGRILVGQPVVGAETEQRAGRGRGHPGGGAADDLSRRLVRARDGRVRGRRAPASTRTGRIREAVFDLPLAGHAGGPGGPRFLPDYLDEHPIDRVGVAVDDRLRPIDADGRPRLREPPRGGRDARRAPSRGGRPPATGSASRRATPPPARSWRGRHDRARPRLARPLRQVHDLRDVLPVLAGDAALSGPEVRRAAGGALPRAGEPRWTHRSTTARAAGSARRSARRA